MPGQKFSLHLEEDVLTDLVFLAQNAGRLGEIIAASATISPGCEFARTVEQVARATNMPVGDVQRILQTLHNILRTQGQMRIDLPQFLDLVTTDLAEHAGTPQSDENLRVWRAAVATIQEALGKLGPDHPFTISRKAERLSSANQCNLYEAKVITDLRPVFNKAGDEIQCSIVTYRLLIDYFDVSPLPHRIEIALDASDVAELRKACERAELKGVTLKKALKGIAWAPRPDPRESTK
jgi:hypothetical protein